MEKFVKDIVSNHFDKKVENPEWKNLEIYGSGLLIIIYNIHIGIPKN